MDIPKKGTNHRGRLRVPGSLANRMRAMEIGDSIDVARSKESQIRIAAMSAGITTTQRRLGSETITTVWRIA